MSDYRKKGLNLSQETQRQMSALENENKDLKALVYKMKLEMRKQDSEKYLVEVQCENYRS